MLGRSSPPQLGDEVGDGGRRSFERSDERSAVENDAGDRPFDELQTEPSHVRESQLDDLSPIREPGESRISDCNTASEPVLSPSTSEALQRRSDASFDDRSSADLESPTADGSQLDVGSEAAGSPVDASHQALQRRSDASFDDRSSAYLGSPTAEGPQLDVGSEVAGSPVDASLQASTVDGAGSERHSGAETVAETSRQASAVAIAPAGIGSVCFGDFRSIAEDAWAAAHAAFGHQWEAAQLREKPSGILVQLGSPKVPKGFSVTFGGKVSEKTYEADPSEGAMPAASSPSRAEKERKTKSKERAAGKKASPLDSTASSASASVDAASTASPPGDSTAPPAPSPVAASTATSPGDAPPSGSPPAPASTKEGLQKKTKAPAKTPGRAPVKGVFRSPSSPPGTGSRPSSGWGGGNKRLLVTGGSQFEGKPWTKQPPGLDTRSIYCRSLVGLLPAISTFPVARGMSAQLLQQPRKTKPTALQFDPSSAMAQDFFTSRKLRSLYSHYHEVDAHSASWK